MFKDQTVFVSLEDLIDLDESNKKDIQPNNIDILELNSVSDNSSKQTDKYDNITNVTTEFDKTNYLKYRGSNIEII